MKTTKLNNGTLVLANDNGDAKQYGNWTAAEKALASLRITGRVFQSHMSRRFYIEVLG